MYSRTRLSSYRYESDSALFRGESAQERCLRYRQDLNLPAEVTPGTDRIAVALLAGVMDSVTAPASLGRAAVNHMLPQLRGPIIEDTCSQRVTFLASPEDAPLDRDHERLASLNVVIGGRVALLPSPREEKAGDRRWVIDPTGRGLPPLQAVLDALLGVRR